MNIYASKWTAGTAKLLGLGIAAAFVIACGGGGGGGTSGGGGGSVVAGAGWTGGAAAKPDPGIYLEFLRGGSPTDPLNLKSSDTLQVVLANYDALGTRTQLTGGSFSISSGGGGITLSGDGTLTVFNPSTPWTVVGSVTQGTTRTSVSQDARVSSGSALVNGRVLASDNTTPVPYVQVEFYDATSAVVGAGLTDGSGQFHAATATTATLMGIKAETVTIKYFRTVKYNGHIYSTNGNTCAIKAPALTAGGAVSLPADLLLVKQTDGPPPPPDACGK